MDDAEFKDPLEGELGDDLAHSDDVDLEAEAKKKKDLIDEDVDSLEDLAEDELEDDEEPFDDVDSM